VKPEQDLLRLSTGVTFIVAAIGIIFGLLSGSYAVIFDGMYALTDAIMTMVALVVTRLIAASTASGAGDSKLVKHFTMGFWHLEPMVLGLNGILLTGAAVYAFVNAIGSIIDGGRELAFGPAIVYAVITLLITTSMAAFEHRRNRTIQSDFVALDVRSWVMSSALTAALLVAFSIGFLFQGTSMEWLTPYVDPAVLALACLAIIPAPAGTIRQAFSEILLVTPTDLKQHVDTVAETIVRRHNFVSWRSYVARVGRGRQIELYFIVPADDPPRMLREWDRIRDEVGAMIGDDTPDRWLTIAFTTDPEWAD